MVTTKIGFSRGFDILNTSVFDIYFSQPCDHFVNVMAIR